MNLKYIILVVLFVFTFQASAEQKLSITSELLELRGDLTQAKARITQLKKDKESIEQQFKYLEDWAVIQQNEKIEIYKENSEIRNLLAGAEQRVVNEKTAHKKTADKYDKIKSVMGYLAGILFALLYMKLGSSILGSLISAAGPWGAVLQLLGPVGAFAAGYMLIQFYF
jgi:septal ring factor EnvC (AmiA/AmiB activator)